jgi:hypothetical protein
VFVRHLLASLLPTCQRRRWLHLQATPGLLSVPGVPERRR